MKRYRDVIRDKIDEVLEIFLDEEVYYGDLLYFTDYITPESQYRDSPEICFNVAEYLTWLFLDRIVPYPLDTLNPYMGPVYPYHYESVRWDDIPIEIDGVYKIYMTSNEEQHEFVIAIVENEVHIFSGYRGWHRPIYTTFNKFDWINEIYEYIQDYNDITWETKEKQSEMLIRFSDLFGLPITRTSQVYSSVIPEIGRNVWYTRIL